MAGKNSGNSNGRARYEAEQNRRVLQVAKGVSATLGADFFQSLVKHLATSLRADLAFVAELVGTPADRIRSLAVCERRKITANFEQKSYGSASGQAIADGSFGCSKHAGRLFPLDELIASLEAQGYVGLGLADSNGQPIGVLAVVSRKVFPNMPLVKSVLQAFAPRVALEIERKRAEAIHRENEERYRAFVAANPDAMWRIELERPVPLGLPEEDQIEHVYRFGYLAECNDALAHLAEMQHGEDMLGWRFGEVATRTNPGAREELRSVIRSGFRSMAIETSPRNNAGEQVYRIRTQFAIVEEEGLRRIWGITRDITELRRIELSLSASERRFREVMEGIELPAVVLDARGKTAFANQCFFQITQRPWDVLSSLFWLKDIIPDAETELWQAAMEPEKPGSVRTTHFEGTLLPRNLPPRQIAWDTITVYDAENSPAGLAALGRDITRERALEKQIRERTALESVGRVAAAVAHDFNNMLTLALGNTDLLLHNAALSDEMRELLEAIDRAVRQCSKLSDQLLVFGRQQHLHPTPLTISDIVMEDERILSGLVGPNVELVFDLAAPARNVFADPMQIRRAIANLVTNARDAMPQGGKVILSTENARIEPNDPRYPGVMPGSYVKLAVTDTGIGLTEDVRARMFEPFFTTKAPGEGTGLGLSTVHGIVVQSGGHVAVESEPGKGTRFEILLPEHA
jgi:signal transduction histidine kinase